MQALFTRLANSSGRVMGSPVAFVVATFLVILWAVSGPVFGFSDTWQLVINTSTTIATFLMIFLVQNGQNRSSDAIHVKLDELIRALPEANTALAQAHIEVAEDAAIIAARAAVDQSLHSA